MKTINDFTPEIQAKIPEYIKRYTAGVFDGGRYASFTKEKAEALISFNYEKCGFKKPVLIVAENPFEAQTFFNFIVSNKEHFLPIIYLNYLILNKMDIPKDINNSQLSSQLRSQLHSQLSSQLYSQLQQKYNSDYLFTTNCYGGAYFGWFKFIKDEFNIEAQINVDLDSFSKLHEEGNVYSAIFSELVCIVSKYPKKIHRNENNDLHCIDNSAIEWNNSTDITKWDCNYINGRFVPEKYFKSISDKTFSISDFASETNEEYKSACIALMQEKYGDVYLVDFFRENLIEIDTFVDKKDEKYLKGTTGGMNVGVYTLFKGEINGEEIAYVRCYCPSTDRMFFLGVDSGYDNAKDAIASLYRIPSKLKNHIKSISRQGERFSTILTEQGKVVLETLSENEISDVTEIDGNAYFSLIKYEY